MKILYIDHHAALPSSGGDCRAVQLAQGWQQCGDEVTIVTAGYSHRRGKNLTVEKEMEEQQLEGVTFKITTATGEFVPDENGKIA